MTEEQQQVWTALQKDYQVKPITDDYESYYKRNPDALIKAIWCQMTVWQRIKYRLFGQLPFNG